MSRERYAEYLLYVCWCRSHNTKASNAQSLRRYFYEKTVSATA